MRELQLLELLAEQPYTSQSELARSVGLTSARVNAYINSFLEQGYITTSPVSRGMSYDLTSRGRHCLAFHQVSYRAELVRLSGAARQRIRAFFQGIIARRGSRVVLYGAGETAEVVLDAIGQSSDVNLVGLVDDDVSKHGSTCHGITVCPPERLANLAPDAIVITSIAFQDAIRTRLRASGFLSRQIHSLAG